MVDFFRRVVVGCRGGRRASFIASGIAVLFVPSRGASLGFRQGASHFLSLGSFWKAWGHKCRGCCFRHDICMSLARVWFVLISVVARASVEAGNLGFLLNPGGKVLEGWHMGVVGGQCLYVGEPLTS